ncbi:Alpha/Beta hydrolase protein [Zychaea mexicana]|uniref:Alpha/Beta hydrolase protein n=1 Tax=Zychaea mexicana TaxID=64656 RepID=UPI0022FE35B0|nr:Alpha/Beta hydrolase protein [Zychaea mexicana]KAI9493142.1 Alpha/Beta hydrolase protein [Zychaea mexicana]
MDNIRAVIKKSPAPVVVQTLRTALTLPPAAARAVINDLTTPTSVQKTYIKRINNSFWKGALIGKDIKYESDANAIRRLRKADVVIFEVHGGGFRTGNATMYMSSFITWIDMLKEKHGLDAIMMSVEYGLAPAHKYPGPVLECKKAYKHLTQDLHVPAWKIILSADSAGGAICLETMMRTYCPGIVDDLDAPRTNYDIGIPAGMLMVSPLITPETTSWSWENLEKYDMVGQQLAKLVFKEYLDYPNVDPETLPILRLSKIDKKFDRFTPKSVLVFVGDKEVMRDDILNLAEYIEKDGAINIRVCKEAYAHDWYLIREIVKQKDKYMLEQYDEVFVDFAAYAVAEAAEQFTKERGQGQQAPKLDTPVPIATTNEAMIAEPIETVDVPQQDEKQKPITVEPEKPGVIVP